MDGFFEALQFLTVIRLKGEKNSAQRKLAESQGYFPLVGGCLGLVLIALNKFFSLIFPDVLVNMLLVTALIMLTGALHLDGLADTADALFSGKTREEKLLIMRDPHKGTFGILGLIIIILLKVGLFSQVPPGLKNAGLFFMVLFSRFSMNIAISFFPYARSDGKAKVFFDAKGINLFLLSALAVLILAGSVLKWSGYIILFFVIGFSWVFNFIIKRIIGGLTGDTLGALCELNEIVVLLSVIILAKFNI